VDLAKAHVTAIARMIEGKNREKYEIFNIGTGRGVSVLELVRKFEEVNNLKLNYKIVGRRAGDIVAIWADPSYANDELGWKAERSLDQTLAAAWKYKITNFVAVSLLIWTALVAVYVTSRVVMVRLGHEDYSRLWLLFLLGVPLQALETLWCFFRWSLFKSRGGEKKDKKEKKTPEA